MKRKSSSYCTTFYPKNQYNFNFDTLYGKKSKTVCRGPAVVILQPPQRLYRRPRKRDQQQVRQPPAVNGGRGRDLSPDRRRGYLVRNICIINISFIS